MANFSVELRSIVEAGVNIFGFPYDFYDENKRREFEQNFIRHFYFREIGCETTERFRWYLEDKMRTVFPYYNELFKAAQIEYNILDNYNVKEEYEIRRKGLDKENNVSSSVGRTSDNQTAESNEFRDGKGTVTATGTSGDSVTETTAVDGTETDNGTTSRDSNTTQTTDKKTIVNELKTDHEERKFLDTPQGALSISDSKYLTDITDTKKSINDNITNNEDGTVETETSEDTSIKNTKTTDSETTRTLQGSGNTNQSTTSEDEAQTTSSSVFNGERKLTHDNNTRVEKVGDHVETSVYTKRGNIGIDTDSDMITKHINLQKVLRNIERMFFDECEDLFMLVYE